MLGKTKWLKVARQSTREVLAQRENLGHLQGYIGVGCETTQTWGKNSPKGLEETIPSSHTRLRMEPIPICQP